MALLILKYFHILSAALWWAAPISIPRIVRTGIEAGPEHGKLAVAGALKTHRIATTAGGITLGTGFALIMLMGGMKSVSPTIHISMLTALAMLIVNIVGTQKILVKISDALNSAPDTAQSYRAKLGMFAGIQHALWIITLGLMVFRHAAS